jgi:glutaredoxin-related protein
MRICILHRHHAPSVHEIEHDAGEVRKLSPTRSQRQEIKALLSWCKCPSTWEIGNVVIGGCDCRQDVKNREERVECLLAKRVVAKTKRKSKGMKGKEFDEPSE